MDTAGVPQAWRLDAPGAWPEQLTFHEEAVGFADFSPTRDELVFGMDNGGDEHRQLFRLAGDGREELNLSRHPEAIHNWGGWSHDGERIAFIVNRRSRADFDGYVQHRDEMGTEADLVLDGRGTDPLLAGGWSPDDEFFLFHEFHSNTDHDVHLVGLASGEMTRLTAGHGHDDHDNGDDGEGEGREDDRNDSDDSDGGDGVRYGAIEWGPDGDVLYVATDRFADTLELATLDVATGDVEVVYDGGDWNVSDVRIDHGSRTLAAVCNIEGYNDVPGFHLDADRELQPLPEPDLPDGVLSWLSFGSDGESIAAAVSTPTENTNVYVTERDTGETERWTNAATAGIPKETFRGPRTRSFRLLRRAGGAGFPHRSHRCRRRR
jgi:dipeptidyl aminopeptidase/acylaminoacyl peptidase